MIVCTVVYIGQGLYVDLYVGNKAFQASTASGVAPSQSQIFGNAGICTITFFETPSSTMLPARQLRHTPPGRPNAVKSGRSNTDTSPLPRAH